MTNSRVRCMFCFMESLDTITLSKEHLLSRPVAQAFGIERASTVLRTDSELRTLRWARLEGIKYGCVCTRCNNGWMNRLEQQMGAAAAWLTGEPSTRLGADLALTIRRWAIKTHLLLCFIDGNAARFGDDNSDDEYVVPPYPIARAMYENRDEVLVDECAIGLSRSSAPTDFAWTFGFPTIIGNGPSGRPRFAPATILKLGGLQLWIVSPLLPATVAVPSGVVNCGEEVRPRDLIDHSQPLDPEAVIVQFADDDPTDPNT